MPETTSPDPSGPGTTCEEAFREIVIACARALDPAMAEFLETDRESGPHKARVALRRLTTALDAFAPMLRRKEAHLLRKAAKQLFRRLGDVRDSDVFTRTHAGESGHKGRAKQNIALRAKVRGELRKARAVGFSGTMTKAVLPEGSLYRRSAAGRALRALPVRDFARQALDSAWACCSGYGPALSALPEDALHDFRKDMKSLRYTAEFFAGQFPVLAAPPFRDDIRAIQDALGAHNDYLVSLRLMEGDAAASIPKREAKALARAEMLWGRMASAAPPWRDPPPSSLTTVMPMPTAT